MRKRQIFIELTPLLDVILILLFVLLVQSRGQVEASARSAADAEQAAAEAQARLERTRARLEAAERRERTLGAVEERSVLLTLSVQDGPVRRALLENSTGETRYVSLESSRLRSAGERLRAALRESILESGTETAFVVFQYDRNTIYRTEYELISGALLALKPELAAEGVYLNLAELDIQEG